MLTSLVCLLALHILVFVCRTAYLLLRHSPLKPKGPVRTMIVLGSGGHTAEMLMLVESMDKQFYNPRVYVVAETDKMSAKRALTQEQSWSSGQVGVQQMLLVTA
eukprot:GHRR01027441.1.p2 GENE.GHRR01027441.1~~GHRR01027441.1.p2  ORF type:complete len:104 (+),score=23.07 GHRR01027441.1:593-904(+)